jgi:hypothetical protein
VECVVPRGYQAYARILHSAEGCGGVCVTWAEVAASTGTMVHSLAEFTSVAGRMLYDERTQIGWPGENPEEGTLDVDQLRVLCRVLADHTATPDRCWLTLWDGWGNLPSEWKRSSPRIAQPCRAYYPFRRPLDEVLDFSVDVHNMPGDSASSRTIVSRLSPSATGSVAPPQRDAPPVSIQSPNQWWPEDRAWCVATEIDFDSTLVGGCEALVRQIVEHPGLEAFRVESSDDLRDLINPSPAC